MKRLDEERQVSRIVLELMRGGLETETPIEKTKTEAEPSAGSANGGKRRKK
jgi:hypothetical protein